MRKIENYMMCCRINSGILTEIERKRIIHL